MPTFRMRRRVWVYLAAGTVAMTFLGRLVNETSAAPDQIYRLAPFIGSLLVAVGWIVTSEVNIGNSRRQHTITLITQHAFDAQRAANRDIIKQSLPSFRTRLQPGPTIDFDDENATLLKAIDLELNFYEFLAVGVASGNLDERLIRESLLIREAWGASSRPSTSRSKPISRTGAPRTTRHGASCRECIHGGWASDFAICQP